MGKTIFFGTDLHNSPSELASKITRNLAKYFSDSLIVSVQNVKELTSEKEVFVIHRASKIRKIRFLYQALAIPISLSYLRFKKYDKIATFWTAGSKYHYLLFKLLKLLKYEIFFTIISDYHTDYHSLKFCDVIICQSDKMYKFIKEKFPDKNIVLIYPAVDLSIFKPKNKQDILLIPSIPYKLADFEKRGISKIIEFLKNNPKLESIFITRSQEAYEFLEKQKLKSCTIVNKILPDKELSEIMSKCKVIPILYEEGPDMPLSAIEGLASGCAIITNNRKGLSEIIKKYKTGIISDNLKSKDLEELFTKKIYAKNSRKTAEELFDLREMTKKYSQLLS
ncbi:MAG: glycosyltransferase [Candidatus Pacearchaeota archaeon]